MFTADGDMRQALNNLQATFTGFGLVNSDNVYRVRQPLAREATSYSAWC